MPDSAYCLWGHKGDPFDEQILTTRPEHKEQAIAWAKSKGFTHFREVRDDGKVPDFLQSAFSWPSEPIR